MSQTTGFIGAVPCPHCRQPNNFTEIHKDMGADYGSGGGLEVGMRVDCDHCRGMAAITGVFRDPYVFLQGGGKQVSGPMSAVPCPHCGKHQDFRSIAGTLGESFEAGVKSRCDHCQQSSSVLKVAKALRVRLAPQ